MPEIRFTVPKKLNDIVSQVGDHLGVDRSDYIRSLILADLRKKQGKVSKNA